MRDIITIFLSAFFEEFFWAIISLLGFVAILLFFFNYFGV